MSPNTTDLERANILSLLDKLAPANISLIYWIILMLVNHKPVKIHIEVEP
jgi:hypothetical protein